MPKLLGNIHDRSSNQSHTDSSLSANAGFDLYDNERDNDRRLNGIADASDYIVDIREYDVPYHVRVAIDKSVSCPVSRK